MADSRATWIDELVYAIDHDTKYVEEATRKLRTLTSEQANQPYVGLRVESDPTRVKDSTHIRKLCSCTLYITTAEDQAESEKLIKVISDKIETLSLTGVKKIWIDDIRGPFIEDKDPYSYIEIDLSVIWVALRAAY